jgi:hypothetical protein
MKPGSHSQATQRGGTGMRVSRNARRQAWRRARRRHGVSWQQRKLRSKTYCARVD